MKNSNENTGISNPQLADTYDWDTVFAIRFGDANKAIAGAKSSPPSFSAQYTDGLSGDVYTIAGDFGPWQLSGGSGGIVHMTLPINNGTLTPQGGTAKSYSGSAVIEVYLNFIPQPTSTAASSGTPNHLRIKLTTDDPVNQPVVSVQSFSFDPSSPFKAGAPAIQSALQTWLSTNLQSFNHTFAAVDLNVIADQGTFQWLKPTKISYAVNAPNSASPDDYIFGVLAMTEGRDNPNLSNQISPNIIPSGSNAGFLISQERFINKIFLPGAYLLFKGASASDFNTNNDGSTVTNINPLKFQNFKLEDGTIITDASIDKNNFMLTAFDQRLELQFNDLNFTWQSGYIVHLSYTGYSTLTIDSNRHLQMNMTGKPVLTTTVTKTTEEKWTEIVTGILEGIGLALLGAVVGGALGPGVEAAEEGLDGALSDAAEQADNEDGPLLFVTDTGDVADFSNLDDVEEDSLDEGAEDLSNVENESYASKLKGFFFRNWTKLLGGFIGSALGVVLSKLPDILEAYEEKNLAEIPTLDQFADEAVSPTAWQNSTGYSLNSGALNLSLQFGINVQYANTSTLPQTQQEEPALAARTA
jgi:hypothetical protein